MLMVEMGVQEIEHKRPNYWTSGTGPYDKEYSAMVAYVVFTREKTTNQVELDTYARKSVVKLVDRSRKMA